MFLEVPGGKLIAKAKSTRDALYIRYPSSCTYQHMPIYEAHCAVGRSCPSPLEFLLLQAETNLLLTSDTMERPMEQRADRVLLKEGVPVKMREASEAFPAENAE